MIYSYPLAADKEVCAGQRAAGMLNAQDANVFTLPWDSFEWPLDATVGRLPLSGHDATGTVCRARSFGKRSYPTRKVSSTAEFVDVAGRA